MHSISMERHCTTCCFRFRIALPNPSGVHSLQELSFLQRQYSIKTANKHAGGNYYFPEIAFGRNSFSGAGWSVLDRQDNFSLSFTDNTLTLNMTWTFKIYHLTFQLSWYFLLVICYGIYLLEFTLSRKLHANQMQRYQHQFWLYVFFDSPTYWTLSALLFLVPLYKAIPGLMLTTMLKIQCPTIKIQYWE